MMTELDIALRVHTEPLEPDEMAPSETRGRTERHQPTRLLVLDCETTTDATQRLLFGWYRYARVRWRGKRPEITVVEEGIFHADDLARARSGWPRRSFALFAAEAVADVGRGFDPHVHLIGMHEFLDAVFYPAAVRIEATIVGFNLPFDLSRLASDVGAIRIRRRRRKVLTDRPFAGGFSLLLWPFTGPDGTVSDHRYRPRIRIKHIDARRALIAFALALESTTTHRGQFLDLRATVSH